MLANRDFDSKFVRHNKVS